MYYSNNHGLLNTRFDIEGGQTMLKNWFIWRTTGTAKKQSRWRSGLALLVFLIGMLTAPVDAQSKRPSEMPDLVPAALTAPIKATLGQWIRITWTVANTGEALANPGWLDYVYLSSTETLDAMVWVLGREEHTTTLVKGGVYTVERWVRLPDRLSNCFTAQMCDLAGSKSQTKVGPRGHWVTLYLILHIDAEGSMAEMSKANNRLSRPIQLYIPDITPDTE